MRLNISIAKANFRSLSQILRQGRSITAKMIKRELYMKKIRPFMNQDIIKVLTGIRRCGKSVMLELIKQEFFAQGIQESQCLTANFESKIDRKSVV